MASMVSISRLVNNVLEEENIDKNNLKENIKHLRIVYSDQNQHVSKYKADFCRCDLMFAYVCRFMITHICMVEKYCNCFAQEAITKIVRRNGFPLQMCSIGGGPGSDLFGFLLYLKKRFPKFEIKCDILDLFPNWKDTCLKIAKKMDPSREYLNENNICYSEYDFFETNVSTEVQDIIQKADIIVMVKFVSAVIWQRARCKERLQWIATNMKVEAILLCIDNSGGKPIELVNSAIGRSPGMRQIGQMKDKFELPPKERAVSLFQLPSTMLKMTLWMKEETFPSAA